MSKKLIALSDALESALAHCMDCTEKLGEAYKAAKSLGSRPASPKRLAAIKTAIEKFEAEIEEMYNTTEEKRLDDTGENNFESEEDEE